MPPSVSDIVEVVCQNTQEFRNVGEQGQLESKSQLTNPSMHTIREFTPMLPTQTHTQ